MTCQIRPLHFFLSIKRKIATCTGRNWIKLLLQIPPPSPLEHSPLQWWPLVTRGITNSSSSPLSPSAPVIDSLATMYQTTRSKRFIFRYAFVKILLLKGLCVILKVLSNENWGGWRNRTNFISCHVGKCPFSALKGHHHERSIKRWQRLNNSCWSID